ncbi:SigE family RNA polymerase sigma factor [Motilibacter aurantiacus]|uniref:SigE family RNA polymerase sigma factor n=1 Tax=Motilibacter aurantiacus TaxID=2714955 RepID=UPI00140A48F4|nr:SigE family RNA polymerase sigma factor [Motilibacter aurantiacus]NHC44117.1 SigE family RNA polymerase sigma factor [Motilibacter aurantiacus]
MERRWDRLDEFAAARGQALLRTAYVLTGDAQAAEDLVQTGLTQAAARWHRIAGDQEAYVRKVMYNAHVSAWRRLHGASVRSYGDVPPDAAVPVADAEVEDRLVLRTALGRLAPRQRAVLVLRYYEDLTEAQTAEVLGCSVGSVKRTAHVALRRLRERMPELAALPLVTLEEGAR